MTDAYPCIRVAVHCPRCGPSAELVVWHFPTLDQTPQPNAFLLIAEESPGWTSYAVGGPRWESPPTDGRPHLGEGAYSRHDSDRPGDAVHLKSDLRCSACGYEERIRDEDQYRFLNSVARDLYTPMVSQAVSFDGKRFAQIARSSC